MLQVVVARAAILDYFESPAQKKLDKIFTWDDNFVLKPGRPLIKLLRMIGREIALQALNPHRLLLDNTPESSILMHNYPGASTAYYSVICAGLLYNHPKIDTYFTLKCRNKVLSRHCVLLEVLP